MKIDFFCGARWNSRLPYLADLGVTAVWIGPTFKQRRHSNEYHGYAIQDFLEIDPHFGDRKDLVNLVVAAHNLGIRVILDIVFNHSGHNWDYADLYVNPPYRPWPEYYEKGPWLDGSGNRTATIADAETGVWPRELQADECYTRAGKGSLGGEDIDNDHAEMKRTDFAGAFGTVGCHFFDPHFHVYRRVKELIRVRQAYPGLRYGRQYLRPLRNFGFPFALPQEGEIIAWSRILDDEEVLCVVNGHGAEQRGADVLVDRSLNAAPGSSFSVIANTEELIVGSDRTSTHKVGDKIAVQSHGDIAYLALRNVAPAEVLVLTNRW